MNARDHTQDDGQLLRPDTVMLYPSPTNPRKTFAEASLQELAESIKQHGIMQPIVVREMPEAMRQQLGTEARLEIVAGERRWRAANIAGLPTVPVLLRDLTDEQVISLQIIENLQREGLSAIEEAEGFGHLVDQGMSTQDIASNVGKSKAYVYAKLKLRALCNTAARAVHTGKIAESVALLIARIPVESMQLDALHAVSERDPDSGEPMSYRRARSIIQDRYTKPLGKAPFDSADAHLVPDAGSCTDCPHRLGNQPDCPNESSANVCTSPPCYEAKCQAHNVRMLDLPASTPRVELERAPSSIGGLFNYTDYDHNGYRLLSGIHYGDQQRRTFAQWLTDNDESVPVAVHIDPFSGDARIIASRLDLIAAEERINARHAEQAGQQRLDVAAEQLDPPSTTPAGTAIDHIATLREPTSQASQAHIKKEHEQRKPIEKEHNPLAIAYTKYRQAVADEIVSNPPLMIAGPLLHIVARVGFGFSAHFQFESDGQAMQAMLNRVASELASASWHGTDSIESLAESIGINASQILDKYVPVPDGCARPNEHGVYPAQERVGKAVGKCSVQIKLANTANGWRAAIEINYGNGSESGPISDRFSPAFETRNEALSDCARALSARIRNNAHPLPATAKKSFVAWLDRLIDGENAADSAESTPASITPAPKKKGKKQ